MRVIRHRIPNTEVLYSTLQTARPGPTVVITANIHGDECTGLGVVYRLMESLPKRLRCGMVHLYPSLNPKGLQQYSRTFPDNASDLNRLFPGRARGSAAERWVHLLWTNIAAKKPDLVLDLHTDSQLSIPYVLIDRVIKSKGSSSLSERCARIAQATGLIPVWEYPTRRYRQYGLEKTLSGCVMNTLGTASLTLEVGPRRTLEPKAVAIAQQAVENVLSHLGLLDTPLPETNAGVKWQRGHGPTISKAGVFVPTQAPGAIIAAGSELGRVYDIYGSLLETLVCSEEALVLSYPDKAYVKRSQGCATLAVKADPSA
ncbi:MAG: succinylglutamate desuccinylase/aspartoacylase family protein [Myxococcota bacterium]|nr:succinylglutamate desuccinylase/aspartoacylase family protein [Myxococcota bacterium]